MIKTKYLNIKFFNEGLSSEFDISKFDDYFVEIINKLKIDVTQYKENPIEVEFVNSGSYCDESGVKVAYKEGNDKFSTENWTELLLKHELTHFVTSKNWGQPVSLFFEGLAVYLADMRIRREVLHVSYDKISLALLTSNNLIPFSRIVTSDKYLGHRNDLRCDVQAGSFIKFLIEQFNIETIKQIYQLSNVPTEEEPYLNINEVCKSITKMSIFEMESEWLSWLEKNIELDSKLFDQYKEKSNYVETLRPRCKFCLWPESLNDEQKCSHCGCNSSIEITIK